MRPMDANEADTRSPTKVSPAPPLMPNTSVGAKWRQPRSSPNTARPLSHAHGNRRVRHLQNSSNRREGKASVDQAIPRILRLLADQRSGILADGYGRHDARRRAG